MRKIIGIEYGKIPSGALTTNWILIPVPMYSVYAKWQIYGKGFSILFLNWYVGIKWQYQPDEND
jgi:hypothetical protein